MTLSDAQIEVIYRLLKRNTPPTVVAYAFDLESDFVQGILDQIRVDKHGTDEIAEAMSFLIWEAYETAQDEIRYGTPASKARFIQLVLARSIGLAGKSTPETSEKIRAAIDEMVAGMAPTIQLSESIYTATE
jgi:hypothetical protein